MGASAAEQETSPEESAARELSDADKFRLDLQGFLVIRGAMDPAVVAAANAAVDAMWDKSYEDSGADLAIGSSHSYLLTLQTAREGWEGGRSACVCESVCLCVHGPGGGRGRSSDTSFVGAWLGGVVEPCRRGGLSSVAEQHYSSLHGALEWERPHCLPFRELLANRGTVATHHRRCCGHPAT